MRQESRKEAYERQVRESVECARQKIKFSCDGLDYFGMVKFVKMGAEIICRKPKICKHECPFREKL